MGMVAREETHRSAECQTEVPQDPGLELGPPVGNDVLGYQVQLEDMVGEQVSAAEGNLCRCTKCATLENLSTIVSNTVCPCEGGKLVIKSRAM